jgi:hypothetical protein
MNVNMKILSVIIGLEILLCSSNAFVNQIQRSTFISASVSKTKITTKKVPSLIRLASNNEDTDVFEGEFDPESGRKGDERNWIEKSSPTGIGKLVEESKDMTTKQNQKETDGNYDLGINGISFQTGDLSRRMYDALMSVAQKRFPPGTKIPSELEDVYKLYSMEMTAKEAVKAALDQNGLELALEESEENQWLLDTDSIQLIDPDTNEVESAEEIYDSFDSAVEEGDWEPGQPFNFVMRNVPARLKEMDISDLLKSLDPTGALRDEAKERGISMPDEEIRNLSELGKDCDRRTKIVPYDVQDDESVYKGDGSKGYAVMNRSDLLTDSMNTDGTENGATVMHVMDAFVNHGCLVIDLTDGGTTYKDALLMAEMWKDTESFFESTTKDPELASALPPMKAVENIGTQHAVAGFNSYNNGEMQFLETRIVRNQDSNDGESIIPKEAADIIGSKGVNTIIDAFKLLSSVGKDVVRVSVAATNMEFAAFENSSTQTESQSGDLPFISGLTFEEAELSGLNMDENDKSSYQLSSDAALRLVDEIIDDGTCGSQVSISSENVEISMSPHRFCRYEGISKEGNNSNENLKEIFGAHTDTSFVTLIPVAATSGLEVFDDDAYMWLRPELLARSVWEQEKKKRGEDPKSFTESVNILDGDTEKQVQLPWHSRYVIAMPGELLQIASRNEIASAVHRVVCTKQGETRLSAPVLLRPRSGVRMNVERYFGNVDTVGSILKECNGMSLQDIYDALQPSSYRE